ncbi:hypothetical protein FPV67DRAFT_1509886 [Lyophyllum atratum]|nr:hypothetical protein FPV67DRAFT_1509886 [Lyophyllum atratum]
MSTQYTSLALSRRDLLRFEVSCRHAFQWSGTDLCTPQILGPACSGLQQDSICFSEELVPVDADSVVLCANTLTEYLEKSLINLGLHTEARTSFVTYALCNASCMSAHYLRLLVTTCFELSVHLPWASSHRHSTPGLHRLEALRNLM